MMQPDSLATELIHQEEQSNIYHITKRLNIQSVINYQLTESLLPLIIPFEIDETEFDQRVLSIEKWKPDKLVANKKSKTKQTPSKPITNWLAIALVILLITERGLSWMRKQ
ncbi:hypothetical protein LVD15_21940 [Fulvivirga maritima]|uniref:hypothetical protein n=1 Tax=Fulvivirga maritima TaxID=2904247 RepID=UPI001F1C854C|nr:hypothetical protein [Fulvivirga maritima]UII25935.1 hypothetical protein LVD15_21940 [Fulvivirga maritima]